MNSKLQKKIDNLSEEDLREMLENIIESDYTIIQWPESQELMDKWWFKKEAILDVDGKFGSSAYLVPLKRML